MTHTQSIRTHEIDPGLQIGAGLQRIFGALRDWNESRVTRKALGNLTDHELNDIGLRRSDIETF